MTADRTQFSSDGPRVSARFRLALSYAAFTVLSGVVTLAGVYLVLRFVPDYPLTSFSPRDSPAMVALRQEIIDSLIQVLALVLLGLAAVGMAGGWIIAGWILRPLQRINEAAERAAAGSLDHRIRLTGRNDEFRQLADTFDYMLERLHDAFATQERFAANASHELRTPLAVTKTMLDVARANPGGQDYQQLIDRLLQTNARAIGLTESLLRLSDANAIVAAAEPVDLASIAAEALQESADEASEREVQWTSDLQPATVVGDPTLIAQLVTNLVQNAIRHNEPGGRARIAVWPNSIARAALLRIENGGPHYAAQDAARLSQPFQRGGGRVKPSGERGGYGLGLALVERIVTLHDGTLDIAPREGGGLIVTVALPSGIRTRRRN
ncbi:histidine kinase [bacterium SCGC AG-212-C10]|nr:histidine kinase [bacterium SCGC AG-212-C10]